MDLKQLRYFLALAAEGNFGRAAQRLHMTQPPLTRQIRALEESLGVALFLRSAKGVALTEGGRALLEEAPNLLALASRAEERARLAGIGRVGRLDVGIFGSGILSVIPAVLARFHQSRRQVQIVLHSMNKLEQIAALRERRIAVGFNRLVPPEPGLTVEVMLRERLVVALADHHPLCGKASLTLRDLDDAPMILYPNLPLRGLAQIVAEGFRRAGARLRVEQEVEDVLTCVALVAGGFGLAITTQSAMNLRLPGVAYRPLAARHLHDIELACIYRSDDASATLAAFLAVARELRT